VDRLHISSRELPPSKVDDASVDWAQRARDNEDLLVFYGICKNYESLVVSRCNVRMAQLSAPGLTVFRVCA
jgi:hypothetical protein